jgi:hypothetical protein
VVFGAQAVNLYTATPRMTQDVDLLSLNPHGIADELAKSLSKSFRIAVRVLGELSPKKAYRVYQLRKEGNRHLADVRLAEFPLEGAVDRDGVRYVPLPLLAALKVSALSRRGLSPKGATDLADLRRLLLAHPNLRTPSGGVEDALRLTGASEAAFATWHQLLTQPIVSDDDADEGY